MTPPKAYIEICFKNRGMLIDNHNASENTRGGNCIPGDTGYIIEKDIRNNGQNLPWTKARVDCIKDGMRLPELFEIQNACYESMLNKVGGNANWEWASNFPDSGERYLNLGSGEYSDGSTASVIQSRCWDGGFERIVSGAGSTPTGERGASYRCAR
jgi:hypothetical protein